MKVSFRLWLAIGFIGLLVLITLSVWTYGALTGTSESTPGSPAEKGVFGSLFPFGNSGTTNVTSPGGGDDAPLHGEVPRLRKVSSEEIAGAGFATGIQGTASLRYMERQTGHVYETPLDGLTVARLTNTTIPAVHDARWITASTSLIRYLNDTQEIENVLVSFPATTTDQELQAETLKQYARIAISDSLLFGVVESTAGSVGERVNARGELQTVYASDIRTLVPALGGGRMFVYSAPTGLAPGSLYEVVRNTLTRITGGISGLEALPDSTGGYVLVSSGTVNTLRLSVVEVKTKDVLPLSLNTLVEKCAWVPKTKLVLCAVPKRLPGALYPDDWHLGRVHTSDELWIVDTESGITSVVLDLEAESGISMDVGDVNVSADGSYAAFIDRNDSTLWVASLFVLR